MDEEINYRERVKYVSFHLIFRKLGERRVRDVKREARLNWRKDCKSVRFSTYETYCLEQAYFYSEEKRNSD